MAESQKTFAKWKKPGSTDYISNDSFTWNFGKSKIVEQKIDPLLPKVRSCEGDEGTFLGWWQYSISWLLWCFTAMIVVIYRNKHYKDLDYHT